VSKHENSRETDGPSSEEVVGIERRNRLGRSVYVKKTKKRVMSLTAVPSKMSKSEKQNE
jgi:hypothetical protein